LERKEKKRKVTPVYDTGMNTTLKIIFFAATNHCKLYIASFDEETSINISHIVIKWGFGSYNGKLTIMLK
jgi:hypothetical protein